MPSRQSVAAGVNPGEGVEHGEEIEKVDVPVTRTWFKIYIVEGTHAKVSAKTLQDAEQVEEVGVAVIVHITVNRSRIYARTSDALILRANVGIIALTILATWRALVRLPPRSPNLNAYAERFVRTIKESCLDRMIFFGEDSLHKAISEFVRYYHHERNHQGLGNRLIDPREVVGVAAGSIVCRQRLGGMLRYYYRQAA